MKVKVCKYCQKEIAKNAKKCPNCGGKFGLPVWAKILIVILLVFLCIGGCFAGCAKTASDAVDELENSYKDVNGKTSFKVNEAFQNKYEKITMTEVNLNFTDYNEYLGPKSGNKIILVKFEVENIGDDDELYVSSLSFSAFADGVAAGTFYYANDNYNDLSATLSKGKKTIGYIFYEVPKDANKITVEYNADFWTEGNQIEFIVQ